MTMRARQVGRLAGQLAAASSSITIEIMFPLTQIRIQILMRIRNGNQIHPFADDCANAERPWLATGNGGRTTNAPTFKAFRVRTLRILKC